MLDVQSLGIFTAKYSTKQGVTFVIECLLGIGLIFLPDLVNKFLKIIMPPTIVYFYWFFLFISVFLGTSLHMISIISFWDKILHFVSPMLLTAVGYGIAAFLLKKTKYADVSPWLFLLFGFAFAGLCGVFWEFWEFICDSLGNMNLQRYNMSNGQPFIGRLCFDGYDGGFIYQYPWGLCDGRVHVYQKQRKS